MTRRADEDGSYMSVSALRAISDHAQMLLERIDEGTELPDWAESKITRANTDLTDVTEYMMHSRQAADYGLGDGKNEPTDAALWDRITDQAKQKFEWPSAVASAWAVQRYNKQGGGWKKASMSIESRVAQRHMNRMADLSKTRLLIEKKVKAAILEYAKDWGYPSLYWADRRPGYEPSSREDTLEVKFTDGNVYKHNERVDAKSWESVLKKHLRSYRIKKVKTTFFKKYDERWFDTSIEFSELG